MVTILLLAPLLILGSAVYTDLRSHRIPNALTFSTLGLGLLVQTLAFGGDGLLQATLGLLTGLAILMPMYLLGGMGAGDVKLMGALGVFLGPWSIFMAAMFTLIAGGLMGLIVWLYHQDVVGLLRRYGTDAFGLILLNAGQLSRPGDCAQSVRFPYALAITVGTCTAMWLFNDVQRLLLAQV